MADRTEKRRQAYKRGRKGEYWAAWSLRTKFFRIVASRYKTKSGEIDLIARRGDLILMVEVKARQTLEEAMDAVSANALRRIEAAGDEWLAQQADYAKLSIRYDLVAVLPGRWPIHVPAIYTP